MAKIPDIKPGDLVKVYSKIIEGDKERVTPFQGVVIKIRGSNIHRTFTVRKITAGVGIEKVFPIHSPVVTKIEIKKKGKVRRAKLSYLRQRRGRKMKIKESTAQSSAPAKDIPAEPVKVEPETQDDAAQKKEPVAEKKNETKKEKKVVHKQKDKKPEEPSRESAAGQETVENT
jgi:large subunit ribosomal protein L19